MRRSRREDVKQTVAPEPMSPLQVLLHEGMQILGPHARIAQGAQRTEVIQLRGTAFADWNDVTTMKIPEMNVGTT